MSNEKPDGACECPMREEKRMSGAWTDPEKMVQELLDAGWKKLNRHLWQSPEGEYFRGPYAAWLVMKEAGAQTRRTG